MVTQFLVLMRPSSLQMLQMRCQSNNARHEKQNSTINAFGKERILNMFLKRSFDNFKQIFHMNVNKWFILLHYFIAEYKPLAALSAQIQTSFRYVLRFIENVEIKSGNFRRMEPKCFSGFTTNFIATVKIVGIAYLKWIHSTMSVCSIWWFYFREFVWQKTCYFMKYPI